MWGDAWVSVTLNTASALDRSEAYLPGWRATAVNQITGKVVQLNVMRAGLIEKVDVPKGKWVIHFHYHAPYIEVSLAASAIAVLAWLGVSAWSPHLGRAESATVRFRREDHWQSSAARVAWARRSAKD